MRLRRTLIGALAALLVGGLAAAPSTAQPADTETTVAPAAGFEDQFTKHAVTVNGTYTPLVGQFCTPGYAYGFVIWYAPGPAPDAMWIAEGGYELMPPFTSQPLTINGSYTPILGDFDDNGCTDIIWYSPGPGPDSVWYGELGGGFTSKPVTLNGTYTPVVGRYFDPMNPMCVSCDGIYWYSTNGGTESIWLGTSGRTFVTATAPQVSGNDYVVTSYESGGVLFYRPGKGADSLWTQLIANRSTPVKSIPLTIDGTYEPHWIPDRGLLLYAPGPAADRYVTDIADDGTMSIQNGAINGTYRVATAPSSAGLPIVLFHGPGTASDSIWTDY